MFLSNRAGSAARDGRTRREQRRVALGAALLAFLLLFFLLFLRHGRGARARLAGSARSRLGLVFVLRGGGGLVFLFLLLVCRVGGRCGKRREGQRSNQVHDFHGSSPC